MDATKPYEFIGFGAMDATTPYEFIWFGAMESRLGPPIDPSTGGPCGVARRPASVARLSHKLFGICAVRNDTKINLIKTLLKPIKTLSTPYLNPIKTLFKLIKTLSKPY